jgi:hypothetical protein
MVFDVLDGTKDHSASRIDNDLPNDEQDNVISIWWFQRLKG